MNLADFHVVDLSRTLDETTVVWPGTDPFQAQPTETLERDGCFARKVTVNEHSGTHFDAPSHFAADGQHVADVSVDRLMCPLHVIDFRSRAVDPDATLNPSHVKAHEVAHGRVPAGAAVFLRTDWPVAQGRDVLRFPGFGVDAASLLVEERAVAGLGIDTLGVDPGYAVELPVHRDVTLPNGVWQVENLTNLGAVPPVGAWAIVGVPKVGGASGFPARVLALVP